jgi:hypothetical protein
LSTGVDFVIAWVIQSVDSKYKIFQASPIESYSLEDWITPEKWQLTAMKEKKAMFEEIPTPTNDYEAAKFGFGGGQNLKNTTLLAYRNNVRQFLSGLCDSHPSAAFYYSASALWGTTDGFGHSANCALSYTVYTFDPEDCIAQNLATHQPWTSLSPKRYPEFGFVY